MKGLFLSIAAALICMPPVTYAADNAEFNVKTTADLVKLCSMPVDAMFYQAGMGYCLGFIDAAHDYHAAVTSGDLLKPIACPGRDLTRQQIVDAFLDWAAKNPDLLANESPINGVMRAVTAKWPCR